jgi:hypothetical protein
MDNRQIGVTLSRDLGLFEVTMIGVDAMFGHTVPKQDLAKYNEALKHGNCLVIVTGTTNDIGQAHHLLEQTRTTGLKIYNEAIG